MSLPVSSSLSSHCYICLAEEPPIATSALMAKSSAATVPLDSQVIAATSVLLATLSQPEPEAVIVNPLVESNLIEFNSSTTPKVIQILMLHSVLSTINVNANSSKLSNNSSCIIDDIAVVDTESLLLDASIANSQCHVKMLHVYLRL